MLLLGLALLAAGAIMFATAIRRSGLLSGPAGVALAAGLTAWLPLLPPPVRMADGLVIGIGGLGLAWSMWTSATAARRQPGWMTAAVAYGRVTSIDRPT